MRSIDVVACVKKHLVNAPMACGLNFKIKTGIITQQFLFWEFTERKQNL